MNPIIEIKQLSYQVDQKYILQDISLRVEKGDFLTIKGASGSGKSTLLQLMASMISPTSGEIHYKGKRIKEYDLTDYRREVSYSFQNATLFGETVRDNLTFPYEIRNQAFDEKRALQALEKVKLPKEYLDYAITSLSGGEKQRVALIRNVLFMPDVLLLDEVTSALDAETRHILMEEIMRLNTEKGTTIVWVTHNTEEIQAAKHVIEIVGGRLNG